MIDLIVISISALKIKIIGVFVLAIIAFIIKEIMNNNIEKENSTIQTLVSKVINNYKNTNQSILLDEFVFSTYDGFWQNFSSGNGQENLFVKIYSDKFEFTHLNISIILEFKHIYRITFSTENRGKNDVIIDKYINLSFDKENIIYLNDKHESNELISIIQKWRIRKSNGRVYGNKGEYFQTYFEKKLIQTLEKYIG